MIERLLIKLGEYQPKELKLYRKDICKYWPKLKEIGSCLQDGWELTVFYLNNTFNIYWIKGDVAVAFMLDKDKIAFLIGGIPCANFNLTTENTYEAVTYMIVMSNYITR